MMITIVLSHINKTLLPVYNEKEKHHISKRNQLHISEIKRLRLTTFRDNKQWKTTTQVLLTFVVNDQKKKL